MKRLVGLLVVLAVSSVAWTDAHAKVLFNSSCVSRTATVCGTHPQMLTDYVQITSTGAVKLTMIGLPPESRSYVRSSAQSEEEDKGSSAAPQTRRGGSPSPRRR